ncbi:MAG: short-chain dehydrogenase/reductase [Rhodospirillales bacterium]|nr:short-chain dehydrogenase/reductase [Rhodospirillales bacterium]
MANEDPRTRGPHPPIPKQQQSSPGSTAELDPTPDHGEESYRGAGRLVGQVAIITGADSGIGRAVAIAFAREGADVVIAYLDEERDARETSRWVEGAGQRAVLVAGDIGDRNHAQAVVAQTIQAFGRIDILVNNAAFQRSYDTLEDIPPEEWRRTFQTNVDGMFHLCQAAVPHMQAGATIINTSSINAKNPSPHLLAYATTKGAIANFTAGLAGLLAERGIRVNAVAPGPVWTPLIPSTMPAEAVAKFGENTPLKRPAQPAEMAAAYVLLASNEASYMTGAIIPVTGGRPML